MKNQFKILAFTAILLLTLAVCIASAIGANTLLGAANAAPMSLAAIAVLFRPNPTPPPFVPPTPPSEPKYLTFTAQEENSSVGFYCYNEFEDPENPLTTSIQYSLDDGNTWQNYDLVHSEDEADTVMIELSNIGDKVLFKGNNPYFSQSYSSDDAAASIFCVMSGLIAASGDITSLLNEVGGDVPLTNSTFYNLFHYCSSLTTPPNLPSLNLAASCYAGMFYGCTNLLSTPILPSINLSEKCYFYMFHSCSSLVQVHELPALVLASHCYDSMFCNCIELLEAPSLNAQVLAQYCYNTMFSGCRKLEKVICLASDISAVGCTSSWLSNVSPNGTFVKAGTMQDWQSGVNGIPNGWTVQDAN